MVDSFIDSTVITKSIFRYPNFVQFCVDSADNFQFVDGTGKVVATILWARSIRMNNGNHCNAHEIVLSKQMSNTLKQTNNDNNTCSKESLASPECIYQVSRDYILFN